MFHSDMERSQLDLNAVKVELEEPEDTFLIVHAAETINFKKEDIPSNEFTGRLMLVVHVAVLWHFMSGQFFVSVYLLSEKFKHKWSEQVTYVGFLLKPPKGYKAR